MSVESTGVARRLITTVDSHTAGHPTRVVTGGLPTLKGLNVAERCDDFRTRFDQIRTFLLHEPRGHSGMVGVVMTESTVADFGAFFLGSYKYLEMCGHATIGLAVTLDHLGLVSPGSDDVARFSLEVPAGIVQVTMRYSHGAVESVGFDNVPAFLAAQGIVLERSGKSIGTTDIAYGGNWYALVEAKAAGIELAPSGVSRAMAIGSDLKGRVNALIANGSVDGVTAPVDSVLFYDTFEETGETVSRQLVVLESNKFDRSPCGTGTSARLAQMIARGQIVAGQRIRSRNILDVDFLASGTVIECGGDGRRRILPTVTGAAHVTGFHSFVLTRGDPLGAGFLCR